MRAKTAVLAIILALGFGPVGPVAPAVAEPAPEAAAVVTASITGGGGGFSHPEAVHVAPSGDTYVADTGANRIAHLDPEGAYLDTIGSSGAGSGQLYHPYQVAVDAGGNVYVADGYNYRVQKFDADGDFVAALGIGTDNIPTGIAVASGQVYVSNTSDNRIEVYSDTLTGGLVRTIGSIGSGNGQLQGPRTLDLVDGKLYIADQFNERISVFNAATGGFIRKIGGGPNTAGQLHYPLGVAAEADGTVFVADTFNARIVQFSPGGHYVEEYVGVYSSGVDIAADGLVDVANTLENSVDIYQRGDGVLVDARIKRGNTALIGNDAYGTDGTGQVSARISNPGTTITWTLTFQNDSTTSDRIRVRANRLPATNYTVRYTQGGHDVTAAMQAGTLQSPVLAPQGIFTVTAQVTIKRSAPEGSHQARRLTATSINRPGVRDVVVMSAVRRT